MVTVSGTGGEPTHHIVLYDGTTELGFVITDQGGDMDERTFRRFPFSDPAQPYVTEKQSSFGGGFGQHKFEDNRSAFWLADGVDTTKDRMVLAPQFHYADGGFEYSYQFLAGIDDPYEHAEILNADRYIATKFSPDTSMTGGCTAIKFFLGKTGTPPANLVVELRADSGGDPGSVLASASITPSEAVEEDGQWYHVALSYGSTLSSGSSYWICWQSSGGSETNHWHILRSDTIYTASKHSTNGSTWLTHEGDHYFRLEGVNTDAHYKFFEYKGQVYFVKSPDSTDSDTLWMNGWRGACDSNSGQLDNLKDSSNSDWASKITGQEVVEIVAGPASYNQEDYRPVNADDLGELANGTLPVTPDWLQTHGTGDDYVVTNSNWWQQITVYGSYALKKVSDIAVAAGMVFFCRNGNWRVLRHREYNQSGTWKDSGSGEWDTNPQLANFVEPVRDPVKGDFLWFGKNASESNNYRPEIARARVQSWDGADMNYMDITPLYPTRWVSGDASHIDVADVMNMDQLRVTVWVGKVLTVSLVDGGSDYEDGIQTLNLIDSGSSSDIGVYATVSVNASGGAVQSINSITAVGYDYTTGIKETSGGAGTDCTINITAVEGFTTGLMAYLDLTDPGWSAETKDIRYVDEIGIDVMYVNVEYKGNQAMAAGQLQLYLDDDLYAGSPFAQLSFPALKDRIYLGGPGERLSTSASLETTTGAEALASIGLALATAMPKSFSIYVYGNIRGFSETDVVTVGHRDGDDITGLNVYGDPEELWVFTESGIGSVANNRFKPVPIREMLVAHHPNNGRANEVHDVYLLFSWKGRLQRYFRQNQEDLGPEFPAGLKDIAGDVVDVVTYPGRIYAAIDGGYNSKSLILCHKGGAWHEVYTSFTGERIRELFIQSVPGKSDKLWASVGTGVMWFPISLNAVELEANTDYRYRPEGHLITSWVYTGDMELNKLFRSILIVADRASDADLQIDVKYQIDDPDSAWVDMTGTTLNASAIEYNFSDGTAGQSIQGNRVRLRISIHTHDATKTPVIRSVQYRMYKLPEVRYAWSWIAKASSISINLRGDEERSLGTQATVLAAMSKMDDWAQNMTQLTVETDIDSFNGRTVLCEPIPFQLLTIVSDEAIEEDVVQVTVNDI